MNEILFSCIQNFSALPIIEDLQKQGPYSSLVNAGWVPIEFEHAKKWSFDLENSNENLPTILVASASSQHRMVNQETKEEKIIDIKTSFKHNLATGEVRFYSTMNLKGEELFIGHENY